MSEDESEVGREFSRILPGRHVDRPPHLSARPVNKASSSLTKRIYHQEIKTTCHGQPKSIHPAVAFLNQHRSMSPFEMLGQTSIGVHLLNGGLLCVLLVTLHSLALQVDRLRSKKTRETGKCFVSLQLREHCAPPCWKAELQPQGKRPRAELLPAKASRQFLQGCFVSQGRGHRGG